MTAVVTGIAHCSPPPYAQDRLWETFFAADYAGLPSAERIWASAGVQRRHLVADPVLDDLSCESTQSRMRRYAAEAPALSKEAVTGALAAAGLAPGEVGMFAVVSCTGYTAPGLDITLARDLGMPADVRRLSIGHMGCYAALPGLATVTDYVHAQHRPAVLLSAELTSLHRQPPTPEAEQVVAHALFGDACAALVVEPADASPGPGGLDVLDVVTVTDPSTLDHMSWEVTDLGFRMGLSPRVPAAIRFRVAPLVVDLLSRHGLVLGDVSRWAIHPGGPRIIDATVDALGLADAQAAPSRGVLAEFGNCSSATVLLVLEALGEVPAGKHVVALTFGPGLTLCAALLRGR